MWQQIMSFNEGKMVYICGENEETWKAIPKYAA